MSNAFWVEIMKPGKWTSKNGTTRTFTSDQLNTVVENFSSLKDTLRPTLRLGGHPDHQSLNPAVGWVNDVKISESGTLMALFSDVPEIVREAIDKRLYRTTSPGLWGNWEYEGETYEWVLNHVALLGAQLPAISGMEDLKAFMSTEDMEDLSEAGAVPEFVISFHTPEEEGDAVDEKQFNEMKEAREAAEATVTELSTSVEALTEERDNAVTENTALKGQIAEFQAAADKADVENLVETAVREERLLPKDRDRMVEIGLSMKTASLNFSSEDEDAKSPFQLFTDQLADGGKVVEMSEKAEAGETDTRTQEQKDMAAGAAAAKIVNASR